MKVRLAALLAVIAVLIGTTGCGSDAEHTITRSGSGVVVPSGSE